MKFTAVPFFEVILLRRAHRVERAVQQVHDRRSHEHHQHRRSRAGDDTHHQAAENIGVAVVVVDHTVDIHRSRVERRHDQRRADQRKRELTAGELVAAVLGIHADEQAARCLRQDPQDRGRGHAIGEKLTHECAEKTDEQAADRTVEHRAHDDGQRRDGDVDPAKAHRTGKVQHNVNCGQHGDGDHFARGHGRGLPREDHRGDEHEGDRDDDRPHDRGKRFDLKGHCEDLLFHQKIFPRLRRRAERLDPVKKKTPLPPDGRNHAEERPHLNSLLSGKRMRKPYCKPWVFRPRATSHPDGTIRSSRKHMVSYSADA